MGLIIITWNFPSSSWKTHAQRTITLQQRPSHSALMIARLRDQMKSLHIGIPSVKQYLIRRWFHVCDVGCTLNQRWTSAACVAFVPGDNRSSRFYETQQIARSLSSTFISRDHVSLYDHDVQYQNPHTGNSGEGGICINVKYKPCGVSFHGIIPCLLCLRSWLCVRIFYIIFQVRSVKAMKKYFRR